MLGFVYFFGSTRRTCVTSFWCSLKCFFNVVIFWGFYDMQRLLTVQVFFSSTTANWGGFEGEGSLKKKENDAQFRLDYHRRWKDKVWPFFTIFFVCFFWEFSFSIFVRLLVYLLFLHENLQFTRLKFWSFWFLHCCVMVYFFLFVLWHLV